MKAISLWQPWASAIANGVKKIETRGWRTNYLGPIAIHAAQKRTADLRLHFETLLEEHDEIRFAFTDGLDLDFDTLPFGAVIATATLRAVGDIEFWSNSVSPAELALGDYSPGRFGWFLADVKKLPSPIPCRGGQRIFNVNL